MFQEIRLVSKKFVGHVPLTRKLQRILIAEHNKYRNFIASGEVSNQVKGNGSNVSDASMQKFPSASRMQELIWDNELMYVAHKHVQHVNFAHDKCRSTQRFPHSGQNLVKF